MALPMPRAPPVTSADLPVRSIMRFLLARLGRRAVDGRLVS
jgi:hypothetical protein